MHSHIRLLLHYCLSVLVLGTVATASAQAQQFPVRRAGLWELTITRDDGKLPPQVMQQCTDAKTDRLMNPFGGDVTAGLCPGHDFRKAGKTLVITATCKIGPMKVLSHGIVSGDFDSNYTVKVTSKVEGAPAFARALVAGSTTIHARWTGACKPKQRPGDIVMADGRTMNIRDIKKVLGGAGMPGSRAK
jgi:hypothetical protein